MEIKSNKIKSFRIKRKSDEKYLRVYFNVFNEIEMIKYVDNPDDAYIFQPDTSLDLPNGKLKIGEIRCTQMSLFFNENNIQPSDYTIEEFLAPEIM